MATPTWGLVMTILANGDNKAFDRLWNLKAAGIYATSDGFPTVRVYHSGSLVMTILANGDSEALYTSTDSRSLGVPALNAMLDDFPRTGHTILGLPLAMSISIDSALPVKERTITSPIYFQQ